MFHQNKTTYEPQTLQDNKTFLLQCEKKLINVIIRNDPRQNRQLLIIENTYKNKDVNVEKIYEKGFTTKPNNTGLGLWEVKKILNKSKNLSLYTSKNDKYFSQQLEIYF